MNIEMTFLYIILIMIFDGNYTFYNNFLEDEWPSNYIDNSFSEQGFNKLLKIT